MTMYCRKHLPESFILSVFILLSSLSVWSADPVSFITDEGIIKISDLHGQVIYVDFWASWCAPCRKSFPWMHDMQARYEKQGLRLIAVNLDKDRQLVDQFLQTYPTNFTIAYDPEAKLAKQYGLKGMPSSYLIGRDGSIKMTHVGFSEKDKQRLEQAIKNELKQE